MKRPFVAVMKITAKEVKKVNNLATKVQLYLTKNVAVYGTPTPPVPDLATENGKLTTRIAEKDGSEESTAAAEAQALIVFNMLKDLIDYVNPIAKGDKAKILLSGFTASAEPFTHPVPGKAVIKKIVDGIEPLTAKVFVETLKYAKFYKVEITSTPDIASSWVTVLDPVSLRKMFIVDLTKGREYWVRVTGGNVHGWGRPSESSSFIAR